MSPTLNHRPAQSWEHEIRDILSRAKVPAGRMNDFIDGLLLQDILPNNPFQLWDYTRSGFAENRKLLVQLHESFSFLAGLSPEFLDELFTWHASAGIPASAQDALTPAFFRSMADAIKTELDKMGSRRGRPKETHTLALVSWIVHLWVNVLELKPSPNRGSYLEQTVISWLKHAARSKEYRGYRGFGLVDCRRYIRKAIAMISSQSHNPHRVKKRVSS